MGPAITWKDRLISYNELNQYISSYRSLFSNDPQIKGSHHDFFKVAIYVENRPEWIFSLLGGLSSKRAVISIDHMSPLDEVAYILNDCRAEWVICSSKTEEVLKNALSKLASDYIPKLIHLDQENLQPQVTSNDELKLITDNINPDNQTEALVIYTSGTTGGPKGVVLSYANLFANLDMITNKVSLFSKERPVLALLPFHHVLPLVGTILAPLYVRATIACAASLEPSELMGTLQKNKVGIMVGVPRLYTQIFRGIKNKIDQSPLARKLYLLASKIPSRSIRRLIFTSVHKKMGGNISYLVSGGAALDLEIAKGFSILGFEVLEGYGMTETAPMITLPVPGEIKLGTCGRPLPGVETKIVDGEIFVKGPNVMKGYYRKPKETAETLQDGWLKTGDLASIDSEGYVRITGRNKELIILSNGKNISPVEIEHKLDHLCREKNLAIKELAVVDRNDLLHALLCVDSLRILSDQEENYKKVVYEQLLTTYNEDVPSYKKVLSFEFLHASLPRTRLEKLKRHELKFLMNSRTSTLEKNVDENFKELVFLKDFLEKETNSEINVHHSFIGELVLDSLSRVSLFSLVKENFRCEINEETLKTYSTPFKLATFLKEKTMLVKKKEMDWKEIFSNTIELKLPRTWMTLWFIVNFSSLLLHLYFRVSKSGSKNIPSKGPCILVANHQSFLDGFLLVSALPYQMIKNTYFYAKAKHFENPILHSIAATNNVIIVDYNVDIKESIQKMAQVLRQGKNIVIFPEGTRTHDGNLRELKKTFAFLSKELQVPIVSMKISGAFEAWPRKRKFPIPFVKINLEFKETIFPKELSFEEIIQLTKEKLS